MRSRRRARRFSARDAARTTPNSATITTTTPRSRVTFAEIVTVTGLKVALFVTSRRLVRAPTAKGIAVQALGPLLLLLRAHQRFLESGLIIRHLLLRYLCHRRLHLIFSLVKGSGWLVLGFRCVRLYLCSIKALPD